MLFKQFFFTLEFLMEVISPFKEKCNIRQVYHTKLDILGLHCNSFGILNIKYSF